MTTVIKVKIVAELFGKKDSGNSFFGRSSVTFKYSIREFIEKEVVLWGNYEKITC